MTPPMLGIRESYVIMASGLPIHEANDKGRSRTGARSGRTAHLFVVCLFCCVAIVCVCQSGFKVEVFLP